MKTRDITEIAMIAAAYAAITIVITPIAYGPLQFRISEIMKPFALRGPRYILALTIGLFFANLLSPYGGAWEWIWMPVVCFTGGYVAYWLRGMKYLALLVYSAWIAGGVAVMLHVVLGLPIYITFPGIFISEAILMIAGEHIVESILRRSGRTKSH